MTPPRTATSRRFLMCPPTHFDVVYAINPWMDPAKPVDQRLALLEWQRIRDIYRALGHRVDELEPLPGLPDMVFAANGAAVAGERALVARFRYPERADESGAYLDWFAAHGFDVRQSAHVSEGQGDFLAVGGRLLAGCGFRSDRRSHREAADHLGLEVISLTLVNPAYYHLDTALAVLDERTIMYYPAAFDRPSRRLLRELFPDAIIATAQDCAAFGLNAISDGRHVVLSAGAVALAGRLRDSGFEPIGTDVSELMRAGGGVKCCTLELDASAAPDGGSP